MPLPFKVTLSITERIRGLATSMLNLCPVVYTGFLIDNRTI